MNRTVTDLRNIAASGGGLILDATKFSVIDLRNIAASAKNKRAQIILKNVSRLTTMDLRNIAASGDGCVVFEIYEP